MIILKMFVMIIILETTVVTRTNITIMTNRVNRIMVVKFMG